MLSEFDKENARKHYGSCYLSELLEIKDFVIEERRKDGGKDGEKDD